MARRYGDGSATITRTHNVTDRDGAAVTHSLEVSGSHADAATTLLLRAADSGPLSGVIPAGLVVTIDAVEYTAQAAAEVSSSNTVSLTISPGLSGAKSDGDAATLDASVTYTWPDATVQNLAEEEIGEALIDRPSWRVLLPAQNKPTTPLIGDLITILSKTGILQKVERGQFRFWDCLVGA